MARPGPSWYSAKCIFRHQIPGTDPALNVYEERVIILLAHDFQSAIAVAEAEAREYIAESNTEYLGYVSIYSLSTMNIGDKSEVYSLLRSSSLGSGEYLDTFYDTGAEREQKT